MPQVIYRFAGCVLDSDRVVLLRDGAPVHVEPQVFSLLELLLERRGTVVRKEELLDTVWGTRFVSESALTSRIRSARQAVGDDGTAQHVIRTVHGRGYELVAPVDGPFGDPTETDTGADTDTDTDLDRPSRLPAAVLSLIGRADLLADLEAAVERRRLVTLTGPGGVGKTALGFELARRVEHRFPDGAYAVELVTVVDEGATLAAFATAVEVNTRQQSSIDEAVIDVLRARRALLLLDNCEHVIEPLAALVHRILRAAPGITIVATSREPLAVASEEVWTVPPLAVGDDDLDPEAVAQLPAVALFVERAGRAGAPFTLDRGTAPAVLEICRRLDGIPLAIELAAARARALDVHEIARRLDERFRLLRAVRRGSDPRHGTLEDAISWSYDLLAPAEQHLFADLAVFAGPFDLAAVERVCGQHDQPGQAPADQDVVDHLARLTERSMVAVRQPPGGGTRYELLETLRHYGRSRLDGGRSVALFAAHAAHFAAVARDVGAGLQTPAEAAAVARAEGAFADLRAASGFLAQVGDLPAAFDLVVSVREYAMRSMRYEVFTWADHVGQVVAADPSGAGTDLPSYPQLLGVRAYGAWVRGEFEAALALAHEARDRERQLGVEPSGLVERVLANVLSTIGQIDAGLDEMQTQLALAETSGNPSRLVHACYMGSVGFASTGGNYDDARRLADRAAEIGARTGSPTDLASAAVACGFLSIDDPRTALDAFAGAERLARAAGNRWMRAFAHTEASGLLVHLGQLEAGCRGLAEMVDAWYRAGEWPHQWHTLTRCVFALDRIGHPALALELVGAIESRAAMASPPVMATLRDLALEARAALMDQLGADRSAELLLAGARQPMADLINRTRQVLLGRPTDGL